MILELPDDLLNQRIASRVRHLRGAKGMSLETLAQRSQVSRSMLSLIERAETSATAVVLEKIANALGVSLATLFEPDEKPASPLIRAAERSHWTDPATGYWRSNISPPGVDAPFQLVEVILPAGCRVTFDSQTERLRLYHQIWLLAGEISVNDGDTTYALKPGDCLAIALGACAFVNTGTTASRHMVVISRSAQH